MGLKRVSHALYRSLDCPRNRRTTRRTLIRTRYLRHSRKGQCSWALRCAQLHEIYEAGRWEYLQLRSQLDTLHGRWPGRVQDSVHYEVRRSVISYVGLSHEQSIRLSVAQSNHYDSAVITFLLLPLYVYSNFDFRNSERVYKFSSITTRAGKV